MRICIADYDMSQYGGVETVAINMANTLCRTNQVCVLSICSAQRPKTLHPDVKFYSFKAGTLRLSEMRKNFHSKAVAFVKKYHFDVVVSMGAYTGFVMTPMIGRRYAKYVFSDHGALVNQLNDKKITMIRCMLAWTSDHMAVLTERTKQDYISRFHIRKAKISVIYNALSEDVLAHAGKTYDRESRLILSAGRFGSEKGYDLAVKTAAQVFEKHPDWQWHIYGDGDTFDSVQQEIRQLGLEKQMILKGRTDRMYELYKNYAMLVLPSYREGLPMVLIEAQANHLPCVSFDIATGPNEMIIDQENGFLIKPYDVEAMARAICGLIEDEDQRCAFAANSTRLLEKFASEKINTQWEALFQMLC